MCVVIGKVDKYWDAIDLMQAKRPCPEAYHKQANTNQACNVFPQIESRASISFSRILLQPLNEAGLKMGLALK